MAIDISPITLQFSILAVVIPMLQVITVLAAIVAVLSTVALVYVLIRGDDGSRADMRAVLAFRDDFAFRGRYRCERRNRDYQTWKKRRGY